MMRANAPSGDLPASSVIALLGLERHPEGGWYRETFRDPRTDAAGRAVSTAIYYLLEVGEVSAWHRVDAAEIWHWHAGGPLVLTTSPDGVNASTATLGPDLRAGQRPQAIVEAQCWQTAESLGAWTLVGCTVAPGFDFAGFELAPADWRPSPAGPPATHDDRGATS